MTDTAFADRIVADEAEIAALRRRVDELEARVAALEPAKAPVRSPLDEFKRPKTVEWPFAWHGRPDARPNSLPRHAVLDHLEAITRARWGYSPDGRQVNSGAGYDKAWKTVEAILASHGPDVQITAALKPVFERFLDLDPEFACFGTLLRLWPPTPQEELDGQRKPEDFKGETVDGYIKQFRDVPEVEEP